MSRPLLVRPLRHHRVRYYGHTLSMFALVKLIAGTVIAGGPGELGDRAVERTPVPHEDHAGAQAQWCALHFMKQEFQQAIEDCDVALRANSTDVQLYLNRGAAQLMVGRPDFAMSDFESGLRLKPDDADLHFNRATVHTSKGEHADAIAGYTEAIRLKPSLVAAYVNRGSTFDRLGEREKAMADYRKALELVPSLTVVLRRLQWLEAQ